MSKKKLNNIAKDTNKFLVKYLKNQKRTDLIKPMSYGLLPGGKKIRSKIIYDIGQIFNINYQMFLFLGSKYHISILKLSNKTIV